MRASSSFLWIFRRAPEIKSAGIKDGAYTWNLRMPIVIKFEGSEAPAMITAVPRHADRAYFDVAGAGRYRHRTMGGKTALSLISCGFSYFDLKQ